MAPTDDELNAQVDLATDTLDASRWPGMTYEQGVRAALLWALGEDDLAPMDGDD